MCGQSGSSAVREDDAPALPDGGNSASTPGSAPQSSGSATTTPEIYGSGSSASDSSVHLFGALDAAAQPDPAQFGSAAEADSPGSAVPSADATPGASSTTSTSFGPVTWGQRGIACPKQRTDGTVRWCMTSTTISDEPSSVDAALQDPRWVQAMNVEHAALLQNQTWHLVPRPKGKNIIGCK
jgi:hypothetical protein